MGVTLFSCLYARLSLPSSRTIKHDTQTLKDDTRTMSGTQHDGRNDLPINHDMSDVWYFTICCTTG